MVAINQDSSASTEEIAVNSESSLESPTDPSKDAVVHGATHDRHSILPLPTDFPKTPSTINQPEHDSFSLPDRLSEALNRVIAEAAVDLRSLFLAAFQILLYRYSQHATIDLNLTLVNSGTASERCLYISTVMHAQQTIRELINHFPLAEATEADIAAPSLQTPAIALTLITGENDRDVFEGLSGSSAEYDLHLKIHQKSQTISGCLTYNASLFKIGTIQRLIGHFQTILEGCVCNLDGAIAQLPLLTDGELHQLLVEWQSNAVSYAEVPIHQYIEAHAAQTPTAIALRFNQQQLTYGELNERANQLARYLIEGGVGPATNVAVCLQPCLEIAISLLAILKSGGTYVPLDPTHPPERLIAILEDTQARILLTQTPLLSDLPVVSVQRLSLDREWDVVQSFPTDNLNRAIDLDQTAYIIYTSGTTGQPKGVMASHRNLINYVLATQDRFGFNRHDVMPAVARFTFSIAMFELLSPLVAGGTLVLLEREHILDFKRMVQTLERLTMLHTVPSLMQKLVAYIQENHIDPHAYRGIKHVFTGGDMVPPGLLETLKVVFPNAKVYVLYGCSEVSSLCCSYPVLRDQSITKSRIGKPFNNVLTRLYDPHQNLVPVGVPGEIYVGGMGVTQGYLNREHLTQEKFVTIDGQRFYRTGDLGRMDADGNLEFLGRADFQVKLRGIRIELNEIETVLRQVPGVREGVVVARELREHEKSLIAYVVLDQSQPVAIEAIRRYLQARLPDYMVPAAFVVLTVMPLNPNQKVDRRALPMPSLAELTLDHGFVAPQTPWEKRLTEIWEDVLGVQPVGVQHNFFEIGGNSLLAAQMFAQLERKFGKQLPLSRLLLAPSIAQLAAILEQSERNQSRESLILLKGGGAKPPLFLIHDGDGETLLYRNLANCLEPDIPVYGIEPYGNDRCPLLHTRMADIIDYYINQIQAIQPKGPYFLGGLCVGGILAFEIARQLQLRGETVAMVALFDAADIEAVERTGIVASQRLDRFSQVFHTSGDRNSLQSLIYTLNQVRKKATNLLVYEIQRRYEEMGDRVKLTLLRYYLDKGLPIPTFLEGMPVRKILRWSQQGYVPDTIFDGKVLLFRSTQKSEVFAGTRVDDTPFSEIYSDPLMGWGKRVSQGVIVYDIPGGHSSMLQEPNVRVLAAKIQAYLDQP